MLNSESFLIFGLENIPTFKSGGEIHIKKKNRGKFTKSAKAAGESVQEHAAKVLRDPNATPLQKKRANFARNAAKWKHKNGGTLLNSFMPRKFQVGGYMQPANVYNAIQSGAAAQMLLHGVGKVQEKVMPQWMQGVMTYLSPLNYLAAIPHGTLDPRVGEQEVATWHPNLQLVARTGEVIAGPKMIKGTGKAIKTAPAVVDRGLATIGNKGAKGRVVAREINKNVTNATRNGRIEVTDNYFNSPNHWYRVSERPEKIGLEENGRNVTTADDPSTYGTINGWRESMLDQKGRIVPGNMENEGYFIFQPRKLSLSKHGAAHGNTSQAAKGQIWNGTFAFSGKFPRGVIEGEAPRQVYRGMTSEGVDSRSNFVMQNWEDVPQGARIGFHTGEMPMSNLGWFQRTNRGTYTYEPIIPEKRINVAENLDWTRNLPGKRDYSMSRQVPYSGYTPIKQSPLYNKFVRDVMQGYYWGKNRGYIKPVGYRDFTGILGKQIDHGAESYVFDDINNPNQVLKVSRSNQASTPQRAIELGTREMKARNSLPYNLPLNIEGYYHQGNTYFPVYSQRKVYVPKMDQQKVYDFDSSVDGMYWAKPDVNNILLENGIERAKDFKLPNIGFLPDGTVMGIDLWKNGGKTHFKTNL